MKFLCFQVKFKIDIPKGAWRSHFFMPRLKKRIYNFDESINDFMIYCTNKDLIKKTMKEH